MLVACSLVLDLGLLAWALHDGPCPASGPCQVSGPFRGVRLEYDLLWSSLDTVPTCFRGTLNFCRWWLCVFRIHGRWGCSIRWGANTSSKFWVIFILGEQGRQYLLEDFISKSVICFAVVFGNEVNKWEHSVPCIEGNLWTVLGIANPHLMLPCDDVAVLIVHWVMIRYGLWRYEIGNVFVNLDYWGMTCS